MPINSNDTLGGGVKKQVMNNTANTNNSIESKEASNTMPDISFKQDVKKVEATRSVSCRIPVSIHDAFIAKCKKENVNSSEAINRLVCLYVGIEYKK